MFNRNKSAKEGPSFQTEANCIYAPVSGVAIPLSSVDDEMFAKGLLGQGLAIRPNSSMICAPVAGKITAMPATKHAVAVLGDDGVEVLIHVGIDTVNLRGSGFTGFVQKGDRVSAGQKLISVDLNELRQKGYDTVTMVVVANTDDYASVSALREGIIHTLDKIIEVK